MGMSLKKRPLGGYFVLVNGAIIGWVVKRGDWKAFSTGRDAGHPLGSFSTRREAVDEVWIWRNEWSL